MGENLSLRRVRFAVTRDGVPANYEHEKSQKRPESNRLCDGLTTRVEGSSMFFQKAQPFASIRAVNQ